MAKFKAADIIMGVVGLLVLVYTLQAVLPSFIGLDFSNGSIWGTLGSAILGNVWALLVSAGALFLLIKGVLNVFGIGGGKGGYGV